MDQLRGIAELLIEKETLTREDFLRFLNPVPAVEGTIE